MVAGLTFPFYSEARITFRPTYKYDIGTDEYDTSYVALRSLNEASIVTLHREKARIPAWCDRVLYKGDNLRQLSYDAAPLRFSDHRPVYAIFQCTIRMVDETMKAQISHDLYERRRLELSGPTADIHMVDTDDDEDIIGYDSIDPGLPPASSDRRKWWLDNGNYISVSVDPHG